MTWQDFKNIARYSYTKARDDAYEKMQERKRKRKQRKQEKRIKEDDKDDR